MMMSGVCVRGGDSYKNSSQINARARLTTLLNTDAKVYKVIYKQSLEGNVRHPEYQQSIPVIEDFSLMDPNDSL
jgi:hypothetical protein